MPIPPFNSSGVLPPFTGRSPSVEAQMSPYRLFFTELAHRFGTTPERWRLLSGLYQYREAMRAAGIVEGFQWIDGSFLEDVETTQSRSPNDIDIVTFAFRPLGVSAEDLDARHPDLMDPGEAKVRYQCDAYFVDLTQLATRPALLVRYTRYWFGLFSHQRNLYTWKGMLQIDLSSDDDTVGPALMQGGPANAAQT